MDFQVVVKNFNFIILQGFFGIGAFAGGTLRLALPAIVLGFILGTFIGLARLARSRWVNLPALIYIEFFRGVPLVMVIFWFWFIVPVLAGKSLPEYSVALSAFVIFEAAYLAEIVRAGIQSVPHGQVQAAIGTGLSRAQMMRHIVLPQALRNMIPALVTQFIVLLKDTSLASIIGYVDLTKAAQIVNNREIRPFELYLFHRRHLLALQL
jgi:polar amino acid transport system permease protein